MKYLGINLTKYVKDQYKENWKNSEKKIKQYLEMYRYSMFIDRKTHYFQDDNSASTTHKFNAIPIKIPPGYLIDMDKP